MKWSNDSRIRKAEQRFKKGFSKPYFYRNGKIHFRMS